MRTRIFRALVCLVLVAALLVQVSPIRARAAGPNFFFVDPELQLASDLIGLGISVGTDAAAHNQVIQDAADWLAETGEWLSEGMLKVYKVAAAAGGFKYMVDADFLQELFEWMFDTEVVTSPFVDSKTGTCFGNDCTFYSSAPFSLYVVEFSSDDSDYKSFMAFGLGTEVIQYDDGSVHYVSGYGRSNFETKLYQVAWGAGYKPEEYSAFSYMGVINLPTKSEVICRDYLLENFGGAAVVTNRDLTLNHVGAFGSILPDSYPEWFQNSTTITDTETGEDKTVVPIGLGQTVTETQGMTQEDIWAGTSSYVDTETDVGTGDDTITVPETVTLKDILTGILSVPKSIAQAVAAFFADVVAAVKAIPAAITEFFTISTDVSVYAVSITDFFPFCIPFDILDFLNVLDAEPEAPKFEWEIDLLKTGDPYLMVVDLSEWDEIAELLRNLELLLFIVGLASVTREKYIRS